MNTQPAPSLKPIIPLALATILFVSGMGLIIPGMPFFVNDMGGTATDVGTVFASYSLASFLLAPLWGRLSDTFGRKRFLMVSALLTAFSYSVLMTADSVTAVIVARLIAGIGGAWLLVGMAYVADITTPDNRAKGIGMMGASFGIGFTIGAGSAGYASSVGYDFGGVVTIAMMAVLSAGLLVAVALNDSQSTQSQDRKLLDLSMFDNKAIAYLLGGHLLLQLLFTGMEGTFSLWGKVILSLTPADIGYMLGVSGVVGIIVQGALVGRLCNRFGEPIIILAGIVALGLAFVVFVTSSTLNQIYGGMVLFGISMALYAPSLQSHISLNTPTDQQGTAMGAIQSMASLARIGGPLWAGYIFDNAGVNMPYMLSAVLSVPLFVYFYVFLKRPSNNGK